MEAFDFALGLWMGWRTVLLFDAQGCQEVFETVFAAGESGGVNASVIGQGGLWRPVFVDVGGECVHNDFAGDAFMGGDGQQQA